jgi:hypothetical protein
MVADDRSNPKNWLGPYADADTGWVALRAAERPAYLASALAEYLDLREWAPEQLAQWLRCAPQQLVKLGLCRRPDTRSLEFHQQVSQIATQSQLDYWSLRRLLEELALDTQQRQRIWLTEDSLNQARPARSGAQASGDFTRMFGARSDEADTQPRSLRTGRPEPQQEEGGTFSGEHAPATTPLATASHAVPARRPSWFRRLLSAIRGLFSKK